MMENAPMLAGLVASAFVLALALSHAYLRFATVHGPHAVPNHRSLHQRVTPKGGGVAIALSALAGFAALAAFGELDGQASALFLVGGLGVTLGGVADDRVDIRPRYRLFMQLAAVAWILFWLGGMPALYLGSGLFDLGPAGWVVLPLVCTWFLNLYNFVDGTDGMAASATAFVGVTMCVVLALAGQYDLAAVLAIVAAASVAFLLLNWPPARLFMGEAGTSFISYVFLAVLLVSLSRRDVSLWVWVLVFAYYFADTTTTTTIRALTVPHFYRGHRSHAYQNLARIWDSHLRILLVVIAIDLLWVTPGVYLALRYPAHAALVVAVVYAPLVLLSLKYGPLYEDK